MDDAARRWGAHVVGVYVVTSQEPAAGVLVQRWAVVRIAFRRADGDEAGDREPRLPPPDPGELEAGAAPGGG